MIPLTKIPTNMFPISEAMAKKVLNYESGRDDHGLDIEKFAYGVGTSHICAAHTLIKVALASLACVDMASEHS
jgi:hypothetical protein